MWPADKRFMTPEQFKAHVSALDFTSWKPVGIVWHNTASPSLKRWHDYPRAHWLGGLESYYKGLGWNGGPHLFCDDGSDGIGLFNPLNKRGTHSPSFNAQYIGIEHVGDFNAEDDDAGPGLQVKTNGIIATAILCARLGIPVDATHIKLHKEDPRTDHDCPGKDMANDKLKSIAAVLEYMGTGGDHGPDWGHVIGPPTVPEPTRLGTVLQSGLNVRSVSSASGVIVGVLNAGDKVGIVSEAMNGSTKWLGIERPQNSVAWVSARYVREDGSGRGSWYSQFTGKYTWNDGADKPNSASLGVPDDAQGVSFYDRATLGKWFAVTAPNGKTSIEQQTDVGPKPNTKRLIDIAAAAAERFGYSPDDFPTNRIFTWRLVDPPAEVASLPAKQQAIKYRDIRKAVS